MKQRECLRDIVWNAIVANPGLKTRHIAEKVGIANQRGRVSDAIEGLKGKNLVYYRPGKGCGWFPCAPEEFITKQRGRPNGVKDSYSRTAKVKRIPGQAWYPGWPAEPELCRVMPWIDDNRECKRTGRLLLDYPDNLIENTRGWCA